MNILVVEDDPNTGQLLQSILSGLCDESFLSTTLEDAELQMAKIPAPDIIFLDLVVPPFKPMETLSRISRLRKFNPRALVVVLTGSMEDKIEQASFAAGADAFLHKNDMRKQSDILKTLKKAISARMASDPKKPMFEAAADLFKVISDRLEQKHA